MSKTRIILGGLLVLGLLFANAWQYWLKPAPAAPELTMSTVSGESINLQALKGKPVLVSFWATSCGLCLAEIDDLIALHQAHQAKGYTTLAISLKYDSLAAIKSMQQSRSLPYKLIYDAKGEYAKAFGGVQMTPTHFFISAAGKIVWRNVGPIDREELSELIKKNL